MLIQNPAVLSENMVSLYFFLSPQRCRISHRRQCASLLHWNLTIPPSLWPDRELRKYHCPCLALAPPPVAIRHLLLRNRYRPDGLHGVQSMARPNRNVPEEWVFSFQGTSGLSSLQSKFNKNPPVSRWPRRRTLVVLAGLHMVCFDFFQCPMQSDWGKKNTSLVSHRGIEDDSISYDFTSCIRRFVLQNSLVFFQNA